MHHLGGSSIRAYKYYRAQGFPRKEPRKESKKNIPLENVSLLELYPRIDLCPEELQAQYMDLLFASFGN